MDLPQKQVYRPIAVIVAPGVIVNAMPAQAQRAPCSGGLRILGVADVAGSLVTLYIGNRPVLQAANLPVEALAGRGPVDPDDELGYWPVEAGAALTLEVTDPAGGTIHTFKVEFVPVELL